MLVLQILNLSSNLHYGVWYSAIMQQEVIAFKLDVMISGQFIACI